MRLEVENVGLPCKGVHIIHLVVLILICVDQIDNIISWKRKKINNNLLLGNYGNKRPCGDVIWPYLYKNKNCSLYLFLPRRLLSCIA